NARHQSPLYIHEEKLGLAANGRRLRKLVLQRDLAVAWILPAAFRVDRDDAAWHLRAVRLADHDVSKTELDAAHGRTRVRVLEMFRFGTHIATAGQHVW